MKENTNNNNLSHRTFQYLSMQQIQEHEPGINRRSFREMLFCSF